MSLLQEAIERHASSKKLHPPSSPPSEGVRNLTLVDESDGYVNISTNGRSSSRQDDALSESDDESFILVRTVPNTPRTRSRAASRSTSPSRLSSSRRRREKEREKESLGADGVRRALDPLKWFPNHITMVIFKEVTKAGLGDEEGEDAAVKNLLRCGRVCKRWRKSQTINYLWFQLVKSSTFVSDDPLSSLSSSQPTWTRKESKTDWASRYRSIHRRDDLETTAAEDAEFERARSEGYRTPKEEREDRWRAENEAAAGEGMDKAAMREYYKSLPNPKAKGKSKRITKDRGGWDAGDEY